MSPKTASCMQRGPKPVAGRTPLQFRTGCGAFQRRSPTGGSANGRPLKARTPLACGPEPSTTPDASLTRSDPAAKAEAARVTAVTIVRRIEAPMTTRTIITRLLERGVGRARCFHTLGRLSEAERPNCPARASRRDPLVFPVREPALLVRLERERPRADE